MKRSNMIAKWICWLPAMAAVALLAPSEIGAQRAAAPSQKRGASMALTILDQNGRPVPNTPPSATNQIFDVTVGPGGVQVFSPNTLNISAGDTVRWTWDSLGHSVTSGTPCTADSQFCSPDDMNCPAGILSGAGTVYQHTFTQPGTYMYFCASHCARGMVGSITVAGCTPPPSGMVGWYPGDGNANDLSSLHNDAALMNGATFATGKVQQAFFFDGVDDYVEAPDNAQQDLLTAATLDAWVLLNQRPSDVGRIMEIISRGDFARDLDLLLLTDDRFYLYIANGQNVGSVTTVQTGVWYHVAGTWDATGLRMYVNGVLENTNPVSVSRAPSPGVALKIGVGALFPGRQFSGLIDEVELINRALSQSEVQAIYNAGSAGKCKPTPSPTPTTTPSPTVTPSPTPTATATATATIPPSPSPTPSTFPQITISGTVVYCTNPVPGPVPNVTMTLSGAFSGSTLTDASGNYSFLVQANADYTVTPTKAARAPGSANINTVDVIAVQKQFLTGTFLTGCKLMAADVNGDTFVTTQDVIAVQRFFLGFTNAIANTGKYKFMPASRAYTGIVGNLTGQNYDTLVFGDVASPFAE